MKKMYAAAALTALVSVGCASRPETKKTDDTSAEKAAEKKAPETTAAKTDNNAMPTPEKKTLPAPSDVASAPSDAAKSATGLASKVITKGTGSEHPGAADRVTVHYTGWTTSGDMFDSSVTRGAPATFPLNGVIKGWTEGVQLMVLGEKRRFWIPGDLAYGKAPEGYKYAPGGRPMGTLVFDVELLEIKKAPKPPETPKDLKNPKGTKKTASGLASRVLQKGDGGRHPGATDTVKVHYSGWTEGGDMFDSSVLRGEPVSFPLNRVIKGWTEGVQLMTKGEKRRFWIPGDLAYGPAPKDYKYQRGGPPKGTLIFDVELLEIVGK